MRIIAGKLGGRYFESPKGHRTHPMSDKVRGALFSMLGDIEELTLLDAFAGSGAISFEAISRGASKALAIDSDKKAQSTIEKNIKSLRLDSRVKLVRAYANAWSNRHPDEKFDIVVCDPPYDQLEFTILDKTARHLKHNGLYVLSWPGRYEIPPIKDLELVTHKSYGDAQLAFYKKAAR
jgi:16S rRNA (guanine966-N2)-methyltransferase